MPKFQKEKFGTKIQVGGDAWPCDMCHEVLPLQAYGAYKQTSGDRKGPCKYKYAKRRCLRCQALLDRERAYAFKKAGRPKAPKIEDIKCGICQRNDCGKTLVFEHSVDPRKKSKRWPRGEPYHAGWVCSKTNTRVLVVDERVHTLRAYVWRDPRYCELRGGDENFSLMNRAVSAAEAAVEGVFADAIQTARAADGDVEFAGTAASEPAAKRLK